jgi:predicted transcriptional regulator
MNDDNTIIASAIIVAALINRRTDDENKEWKGDFEDVFNFINSFSNAKSIKSLGENYRTSSVHDDFLICLEDGLEVKMLKPHLSKCHQMSPDEYRSKWNLPHDYPMVAPAYSQRRSKMAKDAGLGTLGYGRGRPKKRTQE